MAAVLDHPSTRQTCDPQDMLGCVEKFTEQCIDAEECARAFSWPALLDIKNIVICGMGGSAIGGDLLRAYAAGFSLIPVAVARNYSLPLFVSNDTLVIASSYSGNTEETLSAYEEAKKKNAAIIAITTGGQLAERCHQDGSPCLKIPGGLQPRAALGYSLVSLVVIMEKLKVLPEQKPWLESMKHSLTECREKNGFTVPQEQNPAKQLAQQLKGKIPVIYSGQDAFEPVALRWRGQLNENAKTLAHTNTLPEMNHNEILAWSNPKNALQQFQIIMLLDEGYAQPTQRRFAVTKDILLSQGVQVYDYHSYGHGLLARMMSLVHLADYVSVFLAYLYKQDPTPIPAINHLKNELKRSSRRH